MKLNLKNVFLSVGIFAFALGMFGMVSSAEAATRTAAATGDWSNVATWDGSAAIPASGDDIVIPSGFVVTLNTAGTTNINSLTINNAGATTGLTLSGSTTVLVVAGATTLSAPTVNGTSTLTVADRAFTTGSLVISGGDTSKISKVTSATGTINVSGNVTLSGGANAILESTGVQTTYITGNLSSGGTIIQGANSGIAFNGAGATQTIGAYTTFNNLVISNTTGIVSLTGTTTLVGNLTVVGSARLATGTNTLNVGGTAAIAGTVTNNGTMTVTGLLSGAGLFTNGATGTLNIYAAGANNVGTFTVSTVGNTVNYTGTAGQTIIPSSAYYNLGLSGAGLKTFTGLTIANNLSIATGTTIAVTGATSAGYLTLNGVMQSASTWGWTGSGARFIDTTYFTTGSGTNKITVAHGSGSASASPETVTVTYTNGLPTTTTTTPTTTTTEVTTTTTTTTEPAGGCSGGNLFNTSTGAACTNNSVVEPGCSAGNVFNTSTGKPCSNNTEVTSKKVYALGQMTLKNGSKGEAVKELQRFLNAKLALGLVIDGKLGPKTIAVIKTWQGANGLVADGLVGAKTKAMMNK